MRGPLPDPLGPMMPRSLLPTLPLTLFAACATPPPPLLLPLGEAIETTYDGRIAPLAAATTIAFDAPAVEATPEVAPLAARVGDPGGSDTATLRTWLVELPLAEARAVLAGWTSAPEPQRLGFRVGGHHVRDVTLLERVLDWDARGAVVAAPFLSAEVGKPASMRLLQQTAAIAQLQLKNTGNAMLLDPDVARFEHGTEIAFLARRDGDDVVVQLEWKQCELVQPRTIAHVDTGRLGSLEVPVALQQRLAFTTRVAVQDAMVLGPLPRANSETVLLLCVETETEPGQARAAVAATR